MNIVTSWGGVIIGSFQNLGASFMYFLPKLLGAIIVLLVGWLIALVLADFVFRLIKIVKIDHLAEKLKITTAFEKVGLHFTVSGLFRWLVKWFMIVVVLIAAADILGWNQITEFLNRVVLYLPNVIIAAFILLVGIIVADFVYQVVSKAVKAAKLSSAHFLAGVSKWAVLIFALMAALVQLRIAAQLIGTLFTGLVAMLALAGGLAFGLGGKEQASQFLERLRKDMVSKD